MNDPGTGWLGRGFGVALATPFPPAGAVDERALASLVRHVVAGGADFLVALGSTGEASTLGDDERERVVAVVEKHKGAAALVVGTGSPSTRQAAAWTRRAADRGADAALVTAPSYVKPTQSGVVAHFVAVADAAPALPLIAYNVPSRTGVNVLPATARRLLELPSVVALKESSGDLVQIARIAAELPAHRALLAGDDALLLPTMAVGGTGVVSVAGNVAPAAMRALLDAVLDGDLPRARARHVALMPLFDALCLEPNPIPVKAALAIAGFGDPTPRLPLLPAAEATRAAIQRALHDLRGAESHA